MIEALGHDERFLVPLKHIFSKLGDLSLTKYSISKILEKMAPQGNLWVKIPKG
jgi:hypothetical protein